MTIKEKIIVVVFIVLSIIGVGSTITGMVAVIDSSLITDDSSFPIITIVNGMMLAAMGILGTVLRIKYRTTK